MTIISVFGVGIGVAALIIVLSVMGGFENDLRRKMLHGYPNMEIINGENAQLGFSLKEHPASEFQKAIPEGFGFEPFTKADVVLKNGKHMTSASILGINPEGQQVSTLWAFLEELPEGDLGGLNGRHFDIMGEVQLPGIILGESLSIQLSANVGEIIEVISPNVNIDDVLSDSSIVKQYVLTGIFKSGIFNYDSKWAVLNLENGRQYLPEYDSSLDDEEFVNGVALNVTDPENVEASAAKINIPGLSVLTWKTVNQSLLFALKLEKFTMSLILALIVVVAAFSISGTMMMTVYYKKPQVSLLRAIGVTRNGLLKIFLAHGGFIGLVGIIFGAVFGIGVCYFLANTDSIPLPKGVYYLKSLPVKYLPVEYVLICLGAFTFSLLAAAYPAYTASRQNPASGLRYH